MNFPVVLLAGGEGRRIGGDKPLRLLGGERLIDHALRLARTWSDCVRVAVPSGRALDSIDAEQILDDPLDGPLGGVSAAIRFARESGFDAVLVAPCDAPFLPADLAERLAAGIGLANVALAVGGGRPQPACALWQVAAEDGLRAYAETGRRSLIGLAEAVGYVAIGWDDDDPFLNINDEADLARAEARIRSR